MSLVSSISPEKRRRFTYAAGALVLVSLIVVGIFANNGWFPKTDGLSGKRTGWFGKEVPKNAPSSWNPLAAPPPSSTPQLSKENIYAGSRLLAVEDKNASAVPPGDLAVWRPGDGTWYVLGGPGSTQTYYQFGQAGDKPVQGDFDGDGKTDFAVFRPSNTTWYIMYSSGNSLYMQFGLSTDDPAQADYDGDGKTDVAVYRSSTGTWYVYQSSTQSTAIYNIGSYTGGKIAPADYDGDGKADPCIWIYGTTSQFHARKSSNGAALDVTLGSGSTDQPVSADYDGDGKANFALLQGSNWLIMNAALSSSTSTTWQASGDIPVQNDYDGDGKVDIASCHLDTGKDQLYWNIKNTTGTTRFENWGKGGDVPVPAYYRR